MARLALKVQLFQGEEIAFGPGKADLLDAIGRTGSISAAAREMNMSYRRAWLLVQVMNECFREAMVETGRGGSSRGGAEVTAFGRTVLARYRDLQKAVDKAARSHTKKLTAALSARR